MRGPRRIGGMRYGEVSTAHRASLWSVSAPVHDQNVQQRSRRMPTVRQGPTWLGSQSMPRVMLLTNRPSLWAIGQSVWSRLTDMHVGARIRTAHGLVRDTESRANTVRTEVMRMHVHLLTTREQHDGARHGSVESDERVDAQVRAGVGAETERVPWWAVVAAGAAPALLIGGFFVAASLQPASYSPVRDTISKLAARGATDPWVMATALGALGTCYLLVAFGLRPARNAGRVALAGGGVATLLIAAFRQPHHGYSIAHEAAVVAAITTMCFWPVLGSRRRNRAPLLRFRASVSATAVTVGLTLWFVFEQHRGELGLAERCAAVSAALWLLPVVLTTRWALAPGALPARWHQQPMRSKQTPRLGAAHPIAVGVDANNGVDVAMETESRGGFRCTDGG